MKIREVIVEIRMGIVKVSIDNHQYEGKDVRVSLHSMPAIETFTKSKYYPLQSKIELHVKSHIDQTLPHVKVHDSIIAEAQLEAIMAGEKAANAIRYWLIVEHQATLLGICSLPFGGVQYVYGVPYMDDHRITIPYSVVEQLAAFGIDVGLEIGMN